MKARTLSYTILVIAYLFSSCGYLSQQDLDNQNVPANSVVEQETLRWDRNLKDLRISCFQKGDTIRFNCSSEKESRDTAISISGLGNSQPNLATILAYDGDCAFENTTPKLFSKQSDSVLVAAFASKRNSGVSVVAIKATKRNNQVRMKLSRTVSSSYGFVLADENSGRILVHKPLVNKPNSAKEFLVEQFQLELKTLSFVKISSHRLLEPKGTQDVIQLELMQYFCRTVWH